MTKEQIRQTLKDLKISQIDFAKKIGMSLSDFQSKLNTSRIFSDKEKEIINKELV